MKKESPDDHLAAAVTLDYGAILAAQCLELDEKSLSQLNNAYLAPDSGQSTVASPGGPDRVFKAIQGYSSLFKLFFHAIVNGAHPSRGNK